MGLKVATVHLMRHGVVKNVEEYTVNAYKFELCMYLLVLCSRHTDILETW